jgi:hypothetical protein
MKELLRLRDAGKLNDIQKQWFRNQKPEEELFDCKSDPFELNNLANNPNYSEKLNELRIEMDRWLKAIDDKPNLPEAELINQLWRGSIQKPITSQPTLSFSNGKIYINCETEGASIGYKIKTKNGAFPKTWDIYQKPFPISEDIELIVNAHRIGFAPSQTTEISSLDLK